MMLAGAFLEIGHADVARHDAEASTEHGRKYGP